MEGWRHKGNPGTRVRSWGVPTAQTRCTHQQSQHTHLGPCKPALVLPCFAEVLDTPKPKGKRSGCPSEHLHRLQRAQVSSNLTWDKGSKTWHRCLGLCYAFVLTKHVQGLGAFGLSQPIDAAQIWAEQLAAPDRWKQSPSFSVINSHFIHL